MPHATPLITTIVGGLVLAFILGSLANKLKLPPLIGYLCAGILAGPFTPGFVADPKLAPELAELGVILLMFGVGLHFSMKDLLAVKNIAIPGAVVQIGIATLMGMGLAALFDWTFGAGFVFGLALSVASTVVLLKALEERDLLETPEGRIAVGWLIVEDLAMVLALVLLPALAGLLGDQKGSLDAAALSITLLITLGKVVAFVAFMLIIGRRFIPWMLERIVWTGSRELFRLGVLATALGVAYGASQLFGVSFALGAFFAGMVLAESEFSQRAAEESLPLRDAFAVLFFVSVGMLLDPRILIEHPLAVLGTVAVIVIGKSLAALGIVMAFRHDLKTALTISASLAQIGEFSFILAGLGVTLGLLPPLGHALVIAGAILSILLNPLVFSLLDRYRPTEPA
ncbi:Kef family K(+) transporter [Jeongeupia wiesaeckerbachi]|uniref:YbaL family putative K(+) efflux transporter n=1 Tax=Jeongeupia wiesaeckerbachi TaxID=3051218 RepID=UPI003D80089E